MKKCKLLLLLFASVFMLFSCANNQNTAKQQDTTVANADTATTDGASSAVDSAAASANKDGGTNSDSATTHQKDSLKLTSEKGVASRPKGSVVVYCPTAMIRGVPVILNAQVTKAELQKAVAQFIEKVQEENPEIDRQKIEKDVVGDSIDLFEKMRATIEFDPADFKQISKNEDEFKSFNNKNIIEWEWIMKPLQSTRKSIIKFIFYGTDPVNNKETNIYEKIISVNVRVDARSYFEKWADFLLDDAKTTITAILIPFITFLGGLFFGKKKSGA